MLHIWTVCTRVGSSFAARSTAIVPSAKKARPSPTIGAAASSRITLYDSSVVRPAARAWNAYSTSSPLGECTTDSNSSSAVSMSKVRAVPVVG